MTDQPTPLTDDDLSAALDGEADAITVARLADDPAARARQDELAAATDRLRAAAVAPLDAATVDDLIATALDEPVAPAAVAGRRRGPAPWLVAAVVAVLMAVGLGLVWSGRTGNQKLDTASNRVSSDAASTASPEASDKSAGSLSGGGQSAATTTVIPGHGLPTTTAPGASPSSVTVVPLGAFATGDDLRTALATAFPVAAADTTSPDGSPTTAPSPTEPSREAIDRCAAQLKVTLSLTGDPLHQGYATVGSKDVLVYEFASTSFADGSATTLVAAVGAEACDQVVVFER